jgi:cell cycle related kinase
MITDAGVLKVGDFGQARPLVAKEDSDFSHQISTRWYRSPELLFGARFYTTAIDLWAVGVVLAEILHDYVLFEGRSDIEQLLMVFKKMGSPTAERFPSAAATPDFPKICFKAMEPLPLAEICPKADAATLELLATILVLEPTRRATAAEALEARFFEGPDEARIDLATLALETAAARDAKNAKRSAAMDSDSDEDWNQGGGWAGLG